MFKKPLCTVPPEFGGVPAHHVPPIPGISLISQHTRIRDPRQDSAEGTRQSEGRTLRMEGRCRYGVVLVTTGWQELDLIETLGQRQCSAPGSGISLPGNVKESGSIGDDWNAPGAPGPAAKSDRNARRETNVSPTSTPRCLHQLFPITPRRNRWGVRCPARYGFARRPIMPVCPAWDSAHAPFCSRSAVGASHYNAWRV